MMSTFCLKIFYASLVFSLHTRSVLGQKQVIEGEEVKCIESERQALLNLKQGFHDIGGMLSTWKDDGNGDCCEWKGVQCDNETGHVQILDLRGSYGYYLSGEIYPSLVELQHITHLDLSHNDFSSHIPKFIGLFKNLIYLNLSICGFVGKIPYQLGELPNLQYMDLHANNLEGVIPYQLGSLSQLQYLDLGLNFHLDGEILYQLGNFSKLQHLDLSENNLGGTIPYQLGNLSKLQHLDLWENNLRGTIPYQLGNLSKLQHLDLRENNLGGTIPYQLGNLSLLESLRLGGNYNFKIYEKNHGDAEWLSNLSHLKILDFHGLLNLNNSDQWLKAIGKFPNLQELWLWNCSLSDVDILPLSNSHLNFSTSLTILDLSYNMLTSSSLQWLFNFSSNLRELYLLNCSLSNDNLVLPSVAYFNSFSSLLILDLSYNNLSSLTVSWLFNLSSSLRELRLTECDILDNNFIYSSPSYLDSYSSLFTLDLSDNKLKSSTIFHWIFNFTSSLHKLDINGNLLEGPLPDDFGSIMNSLEELYLFNNNLNGQIPYSIGNLCKLQILDLSYNNLSGVIPNLSNFSSLAILRLGNNSLVGEIPNFPLKFAYAPEIALSSNQFEGTIPSFLSQASALFLSENKFSDGVHFLCNATKSLEILKISKNKLTGQLPDCWSHLKSLFLVDLSNNNLTGRVPISMGSLVEIKALLLRNNNLIGLLPSTLKNCTKLVILDVGENKISGSIPPQIGESLQQLVILSLQANNLNGSIPSSLCHLRQIRVLDLSQNNLSNDIPTCIKNFTGIAQESNGFNELEIQYYWYAVYISLTWKSVERDFKNTKAFLRCIDLSSNNLTGKIPIEFGYLFRLISLNLSRNKLIGKIPSEIGNLKSLEVFDLSRNHLSGRIPSSLAQIDTLSVINLSNNNLYGEIPVGRHFQTFDASSFDGNLNLCGKPLDKMCQKYGALIIPDASSVTKEDYKNSDFLKAFFMSMGLGFPIGFWGLIVPILIKRSWRFAYIRFLNKLINNIYVRD